MEKSNKFFLISILVVFLLVSMLPFSAAQDNQATNPNNSSNASNISNTNYVCAIYFTGAGCPHCARAKPVIEKIVNETPNLVLIKYEVQQEPENAPVFGDYGTDYGFSLSIPLILFGKNDYLQGDQPIIDGLRNKVNSMYSNPCPLLNGSFVNFNSCDFNSLPGKPEILISGRNVPINNTNNTNGSCQPQPKPELTLAKIISLAAVDAINPCAFAVLILILVAILTANPNKKSKVLWAGLAFALAVFLTYLLYGIIIVIFFQAIRALTYVKPFLHIVIAVVAILLGLLNIRDFLSYVPGRFATEMPVMFRPKVKKIISKVTSPLGAFIVGAFVTTFLLPCTVGPYLIAGGILSSLQLVHTLPWLGLYNFVFALPMVIITLVIYFGFSSVENVSGWRERNIKYIHLVAGLIMLILGIAMLAGLI